MKKVLPIMSLAAALTGAVLAGCASDNVAWHNAHDLNSRNPPVGVSTATLTTPEAEPVPRFYPSENGSYGVGQSEDTRFGGVSGTRAVVPLTSADMHFMQEAMSAGVLAVDAGQEALRKSSDAHIQGVARQTIDDRTRMDNQLANLAASMGAALPARMNPQDAQLLGNLQAANGADFDQLYLNQLVSSQNALLAIVENEASFGNDTDLRTWADSMAPVIRGDLVMITTPSATTITSER